MEFDIGEDFFIRPEMHFGAALVGVASDLDGRHDDAVLGFDFTVLRDALGKLHVMHFAIATDRQLEQLGQAIHA